MAAPRKPKGAKSDKEWRGAIMLAIKELRAETGNAGKVKALRLLARKLVDKGLDGDIAALKEIGDRLDGRPSQAHEVNGPDGSPITSWTPSALTAGGAQVRLPTASFYTYRR